MTTSEETPQADRPISTKVEIAGHAPLITVRVGGHMLPCECAILELNAEALPVLKVQLPVVDDVVVTLDDAYAQFAQETRAALVTMGWTPPPAADTP